LVENSGDRDDPHNPKKDIENTHKLPINRKRKIQNNKQEVGEVIPGEYVLLENMELNANIEDIKFPGDKQRVQLGEELVI
jgi:hypothetical protein